MNMFKAMKAKVIDAGTQEAAKNVYDMMLQIQKNQLITHDNQLITHQNQFELFEKLTKIEEKLLQVKQWK